jgi:hypothetical protein
MEGRLQKAGLSYYRDEDRAMKSDGRHDEVSTTRVSEWINHSRSRLTSLILLLECRTHPLTQVVLTSPSTLID